MVVTVRETYDLATVKNKMTLIAVHTPHPDIIKRNFPGLLMQCKAYRPLSCDVRMACASVQNLDPLQVGTTEGDVAPEDMFNPILYKALTNVGMSQLEARINSLALTSTGADVIGDTATVDVDSVYSSGSDDFPIYYGLLSNYHGWKTASPQAGLTMTGLRPLVYEILANFADQQSMGSESSSVNNTLSAYPAPIDGAEVGIRPNVIRGNAKPVPFINCTSYSYSVNGSGVSTGFTNAGFTTDNVNNTVVNGEMNVPWINCVCAGLIIPPSRLHQLFYRLIVEWHLEFTGIRPLAEILPVPTLGGLGNATHYQNYSYAATKEALTGSDESILDNDTCMVSTTADIKKVM